MSGRIGRNLSYANVTASLALFVALGGTGYAAIKLPANSVGAKQIKKSAVTNKKIGADAVTGSKVKNSSLTAADLKLSTLPKAPTAANADHAANADNASHAATADNATNAGTANSIAAPETFHEVGAAGEPGFSPGASNTPSGTPLANFQTAGFYKDKEGVVHLKGLVTGGTGDLIFQLPEGYRPGSKRILAFTAYCVNCTETDTPGNDTNQDRNAPVLITGSDAEAVYPAGAVVTSAGSQVSLNGITFRAGE
jgi:hypothetical protein